MSKNLNKKIYRILDANFNRLKEGLRVGEEICRFVLDNKHLTIRFKNIRHKVSNTFKLLPLKSEDLSKSRDSESDVARTYSQLELKRKDILDIFYANIQRSKESLRVLEEFTKLINPKISLRFKCLRYEVYSLEKNTLGKPSSLCHFR